MVNAVERTCSITMSSSWELASVTGEMGGKEMRDAGSERYDRKYMDVHTEYENISHKTSVRLFRSKYHAECHVRWGRSRCQATSFPPFVSWAILARESGLGPLASLPPDYYLDHSICFQG